MNHISIRKLGLAFGITGALLYFGCAVVMLTLGHDSTVKFFRIFLDHKAVLENYISWNRSGVIATLLLKGSYPVIRSQL